LSRFADPEASLSPMVGAYSVCRIASQRTKLHLRSASWCVVFDGAFEGGTTLLGLWNEPGGSWKRNVAAEE
jgi:hypothetical protein